MKVYDQPIIIEKIDEETEKWVEVFSIHAEVNKGKSDSEYLSAGAVRAKKLRTFDIRFFKAIEAIEDNTQNYRIIFKGIPFNVIDYDDYKSEHKNVRLLGAAY